jgi:hypothetical protein
MEESWIWSLGDSSHNILLTLGALQVLSRSQVTWSCQCPYGYGRYVKSTCFVYKAIGGSHSVACRAWRYLRMQAYVALSRATL